MADRALSICPEPGCRTLVRGGRCPAHVRPPSAFRERASACRRGYGRTWERLRLFILAREPLCRECGVPATEVDHIVPLRQGGTNAPENLQSLCASCHSRKTAKRDGAFGRPPRLDGARGPATALEPPRETAP